MQNLLIILQKKCTYCNCIHKWVIPFLAFCNVIPLDSFPLTWYAINIKMIKLDKGTNYRKEWTWNKQYLAFYIL